MWICLLCSSKAQELKQKNCKVDLRPNVGVSQHNWVETNRFADLPSLGGEAPRTSTETATLTTIGIQIKNNYQNRFKFLMSVNYLLGNTNFNGAAQQVEISSAFKPQAFQVPLSGIGHYSGQNAQTLLGYSIYSNAGFSLLPQIGLSARSWQRNLPSTTDPMVVVLQRRYLLFQYQLGFQININQTLNSRFYTSLLLSNPVSFVATITGVSNADGGETIFNRRLESFMSEPFPKTPESIQDATNVIRQWSNLSNNNGSITAINGFKPNVNLKIGYEYKRWQAEFYYDSFRFVVSQKGYNPSVNGFMTGLNVSFKIW